MQTSEVLNLAADLIEERGWTQGASGWPSAYRVTAHLCLEGAIMAATNVYLLTSEFLACPAYRAVSEYLGRDMVFLWNDEEASTADEVIEVLRAAAVIEAARESKAAEVAA